MICALISKPVFMEEKKQSSLIAEKHVKRVIQRAEVVKKLVAHVEEEVK